MGSLHHLLIVLSLAGCGFTPQGDLLRSAVKERGAEAFDAGLENAEWFLCQAASVGSVQRRYGGSADMANAYRVLCGRGGEVIR